MGKIRGYELCDVSYLLQKAPSNLLVINSLIIPITEKGDWRTRQWHGRFFACKEEEEKACEHWRVGQCKFICYLLSNIYTNSAENNSRHVESKN